MKFIYLQDVHCKGVNPSSRIGDYYTDIMTKFDEVLTLSKQYKVDYIIDGGDFFDSPLVSNIIIDEFIDKVEQNAIPMFMLYGNHCQIGHSIDNSKSTSLAHIFRRSKYIKHLETLIDNNKEQKVLIEGLDYYHNIETDIQNNGLKARSEANYKICVCHALLSDKVLPTFIRHVAIGQIKTDYDLVISGHNHKGWGIIQIGTTKFVNISSLSRTSIDESEIIPSVLYIDTNTKKLEIIPLKNIKPKELALDILKINESNLFEVNIENFIRSLESAKIQGLNLTDIIIQLAKNNNIEHTITNELLNRIEQFEN